MGISVVHNLPAQSANPLAGNSAASSDDAATADFANLLLSAQRPVQSANLLKTAGSATPEANLSLSDDEKASSDSMLAAMTDPSVLTMDPSVLALNANAQANIQTNGSQTHLLAAEATSLESGQRVSDASLSFDPAQAKKQNADSPTLGKAEAKTLVADQGLTQTALQDATQDKARPAAPTTSSRSDLEQAIVGGKQQLSATESSLPAKLAADNTATGSSFMQSLQSAESRAAAKHAEWAPPMQTPVTDSRWGSQLGDRVVWMARQDMQSAQINITPAQLGPIQINIDLKGDQMTATFVSTQPEVRQAIEDALPKLRETLAGAGISLGQTNVGAQTSQQQQDGSFKFAETPRWQGEEAILPADSQPAPLSSVTPLHRGRGLVDLFA